MMQFILSILFITIFFWIFIFIFKVVFWVALVLALPLAIIWGGSKLFKKDFQSKRTIHKKKTSDSEGITIEVKPIKIEREKKR